MNNAPIGALIAASIFVLLFLGFALGRTSIKADCDNFGAVVIDSVKFECKRATL